MMRPASVDELSASWFSEILDADVTAVEVLDAHSGTTGRARIGLQGGPDVPPSVFVKLQPFDADQRDYLRMVGMGVAEARLYREVGAELPVRIPHVWHSSFDDDDGSFVMVLEDLGASGCRFPSADDPDVADVARSLMSELARLHAAYWDQDLPWLRNRALGSGTDDHQLGRLARLGQIVQVANDRFADAMPPEFRRLCELFVSSGPALGALWNEGTTTLVHGDDHVRNLFVDNGRTGFFDWAVACRAPALRDVSYFLCNSLPTEVRRREQSALLGTYRSAMAGHGITLDDTQVEEQYRLFAAYSWMSSTTTAAMGSNWHPAAIGETAMVRTTEAIVDLDVVGLIEAKLA